MRRYIILALALAAVSHQSAADETQIPYAGLETREIATLSESDIADLEAGRGWGFALAAELNGHPGPAHVLELAEDLDLSADQIARMGLIFQEMQEEAVALGTEFIAAERALNAAFTRGRLNAPELVALVNAAGNARANLRFVHLSSHLQTLDVLTIEQIDRYNILRGYSDDPCANIPEGHNEAMWRRHNGCDR
ncbi:hypothetical protein SAMN04488515_0314 [Cognatiyoonia koreensis]|uniref:Heavy-metal resistance n=1 Tax=Cognatiyoonia koreensis TaxID=364200 RepID=A0A1I0MYT5_9RHOB|nr:hypothetical protein [Cognatiyoonia koreensis]SEV93810.1 hypothetical protein SAMN04488515_0314 [Cognatiyoonia koreensis]